jgi:hypothetical protein
MTGVALRTVVLSTALRAALAPRASDDDNMMETRLNGDDENKRDTDEPLRPRGLLFQRATADEMGERIVL